MHTQLLLIFSILAWVSAESEPQKLAKSARDSEQARPEINTIPGHAGVDFPIFAAVPQTSFSCQGKIAGYYADTEASCQVWHYCSQIGDMDSFLCANGTIFSQERRTCQWWYDTDCSETNKFMDVNQDLYIVPTTTKAPATEKSDTPLKKLRRAAGY